LPEGKGLYDEVYPSCMIVGGKSKRDEIFPGLLAKGEFKSDVELLFTGAREAEAFNFFLSNYIAMRVVF
jgi:UDPglucose 6-dehydrogenase